MKNLVLSIFKNVSHSLLKTVTFRLRSSPSHYENKNKVNSANKTPEPTRLIHTPFINVSLLPFNLYPYRTDVCACLIHEVL